MEKLFYAVAVALLALGTVITQGTASLQNFTESSATYAFKADIGNLNYLEMVRDQGIIRIKAVGGTSVPLSTSTSLLFKCTDRGTNKVTCQPANGQGYVSRDQGHNIVVSPITQGVMSEFTIVNFNSQGSSSIPNSGYLDLQADDGGYWSIGPSNRIRAVGMTPSSSQHFLVVKL